MSLHSSPGSLAEESRASLAESLAEAQSNVVKAARHEVSSPANMRKFICIPGQFAPVGITRRSTPRGDGARARGRSF